MIIEPSLLLAFAAAVTLLMLIPGPNVALIVANSVTYGSRHGLMTVAGTVAAQALSLALVTAGLTTLLEFFGFWFGWLRWRTGSLVPTIVAHIINNTIAVSAASFLSP